MSKELYQGMIMKALDWAYEKSLDPGVPGLDSAYDLAEDYMDSDKPLDKQVNSLIHWQDTKGAASGFITGLGGILTLPVAIPANIASVLFVQVRMIAAIAIMGGHDIKDDKVKTLVYICLLGNAAKEVMKEVGIKIGAKLTQQAIKKMSFEVIKKINQKVGFRLLTKFGEKGVINLGKAIPIVAGLIGGTLDAVSTHVVGKIAKKIFIAK